MQDKYYHRAKQAGYRARSVFKLEQIQKKFKVLRLGMDVLDLGSAPGSWLQYACKIVGPKGKLVGIDLLHVDPVGENVFLYQEDIFSRKTEDIIEENFPKGADVVLSDLAPKTTGIRETDHFRSIELSQRVSDLAQKFLRPHGTVVFKVFQGSDFDQFLSDLRRKFKRVKPFKPDAVRTRSVEIYIIATK